MQTQIILDKDELKAAVALYLRRRGYVVKESDIQKGKPDVSFRHEAVDRCSGVFEYKALATVEVDSDLLMLKLKAESEADAHEEPYCQDPNCACHESPKLTE